MLLWWLDLVLLHLCEDEKIHTKDNSFMLPLRCECRLTYFFLSLSPFSLMDVVVVVVDSFLFFQLMDVFVSFFQLQSYKV